MSVSSLCNNTAAVTQLTNTTNEMGGVSKAYTSRIASMPCRLTKKSLSETDEYGKLTVREIIRLYCVYNAANAAIVESDRIAVNSKTYEVTAIYNPSDIDNHLEIDMVEIR